MSKSQYSFIADENFSATVDEIVQAARSFVGIPYKNQGRDFRGMDCGGFILELGRRLRYTDLRCWAYADFPINGEFERLLDAFLVRIEMDETQVGDIVAMDYGRGLQHIALVSSLSPRMMLIHSKKPKGVVEHFIHGYDRRAWVRTYRWKHLLSS